MFPRSAEVERTRGKEGEKHILPHPFLTVAREDGEKKKQNLKSISMAPALSFLTSEPTKHFFKTSFS